VGKIGAFYLPFNLGLSKLICSFLILISILITLLFYLDFYEKIILNIKPEFCSILLFLGFGSTMAFLQNDLFSFFLYFEIISFCIYGLLFLHKRTNAQLHSLVRYVLLSLWVSTCYIFGLAFYLISCKTSTTLFNFGEMRAISLTLSPKSSTILNFEYL
jgi:NADH:ubiquinone oxidoreductase subunit 2 (subunit N)